MSRHLRLDGLHVVQLHLCEQRMPNSVPTDVVDDLTCHQSLLVDDQRTREIDGEVSETLGGLHDAEDQRVVRPVEPLIVVVLVTSNVPSFTTALVAANVAPASVAV